MKTYSELIEAIYTAIKSGNKSFQGIELPVAQTRGTVTQQDAYARSTAERIAKEVQTGLLLRAAKLVI